MKLFINANRTGYSPDQIRHTMTVAELIAALQEFPDDAPVYLKHDNGYTYGGIGWTDLEDDWSDEENEWNAEGKYTDEEDWSEEDD